MNRQATPTAWSNEHLTATRANDDVRIPKQAFNGYYWVAAALFASDVFLHKSASDVCDWLAARLGFAVYDRSALLGIMGVSALAGAAVLWRRRVAVANVPALVLLTAATAIAQRWLLVTNIELIHLPQYAILSAVLIAGGMAVPVAWLVASTLGVIDESYQYFVVYVGRPDVYLDYNDMVLNALGAAWGLWLTASTPAVRQRWSVRYALAALVIIGVGMLVIAPLQLPLLRAAPTGRWYHVMSFAEAVLVWVALWSGAVRPLRAS